MAAYDFPDPPTLSQQWPVVNPLWECTDVGPPAIWTPIEGTGGGSGGGYNFIEYTPGTYTFNVPASIDPPYVWITGVGGGGGGAGGVDSLNGGGGGGGSQNCVKYPMTVTPGGTISIVVGAAGTGGAASGGNGGSGANTTADELTIYGGKGALTSGGGAGGGNVEGQGGANPQGANADGLPGFIYTTYKHGGASGAPSIFGTSPGWRGGPSGEFLGGLGGATGNYPGGGGAASYFGTGGAGGVAAGNGVAATIPGAGGGGGGSGTLTTGGAGGPGYLLLEWQES